MKMLTHDQIRKQMISFEHIKKYCDELSIRIFHCKSLDMITLQLLQIITHEFEKPCTLIHIPSFSLIIEKKRIAISTTISLQKK